VSQSQANDALASRSSQDQVSRPCRLPPGLRLIFRVASVFWYSACGLCILMGLVMCGVALTDLLGPGLFGAGGPRQFGLVMLAFSLVFISFAIAFVFVGRRAFRQFLEQPQAGEKLEGEKIEKREVPSRASVPSAAHAATTPGPGLDFSGAPGLELGRAGEGPSLGFDTASRRRTVRLVQDLLFFVAAAAVGFAAFRFILVERVAHREPWEVVEYWVPLLLASIGFGVLRSRDSWRWGLAVTCHLPVVIVIACFTDPRDVFVVVPGMLALLELLWVAPFMLVNLGLAQLAGLPGRRAMNNRRARQLEELARELGLQFSAQSAPELLKGRPKSRLFSGEKPDSNDIRNVLQGKANGVEIIMFDYHTLREHDNWEVSGDSGSSGLGCLSVLLGVILHLAWEKRQRTVVRICSPELTLPHFVVRRVTLWHRLALVLDSVEVQSCPAFSRQYRVEGDDPDQVRAVLMPPTLAFLARHRGIACEGHGQEILFCRRVGLAEPEELRPLLDQALALYAMLRNPARDS